MPDTTPTTAPVTPSPIDMSRAVIEHALVNYGYSADTAHVWVSVPGWSPRRAFLTGAQPFAAAAGCAPEELAGRMFFADLDLYNPPGNDDTSGERLDFPGLRECPPLPASWLNPTP